MNGRARGTVLLAVCAALAGCVATQKNMLELSEQSDELKEQVEELKKTVGSMQANQADLSVRIQSLREELTAYTETVKSSMGDMGKLSAKLDELGQQLTGKVAALGQSLTQAQQKGLEEQKAALADAKREGAATDLFVTSEKRLQAKEYAKAASGFEQYLKENPKGELADVAQYNLGLAYEGGERWEKAGKQFAIVLEKYPKSGQTPGARLHYARSLLALKRGLEEAQAYLESVVSDFPGSPEAKEAAAALKKLAPRAKPVKR